VTFFTRLFTLRFRGDPDQARLRALQERLGLEDQGSRLDDEDDSEFGYGNLQGDGDDTLPRPADVAARSTGPLVYRAELRREPAT
jgi:hypothetical protein